MMDIAELAYAGPAAGLARKADVDQIVTASRTNFAKWSETFGNWATFQSGIVLSNVTTAPDGTMTADKLATDAGGVGYRAISQVPSGLPAGRSGFALYAKAAELDKIQISDNGSGAGISGAFNLTAGTCTGTGATIEAVGGGWYLCKVMGTTNVAPTNMVIFLADAAGNLSWPAAGTLNNGVYVWGAQIAVGVNAMPAYSATGSAPVTRLYSNPQSPTMTPASATALGVVGEWAWDASYIYVCTAANTWKRAALSTW